MPFKEGELFRKSGKLYVCTYIRECPKSFEIDELKEGKILPIPKPEKRLCDKKLLERVFG